MKELQDVQAKLERHYDEASNDRMSWTDARSAACIVGEIATVMQAHAAKAGRTSRRRGSFDQADRPADKPPNVVKVKDGESEKDAARRYGIDPDSVKG